MKSTSILRIAGAAIAAMLVVSTADAQSPTGGATVITAPNVTQSHLAAARELVVASGLSRTFAGLIPDLMLQVNGTVTRTRPELAADMKATLEGIEPEFIKLQDEMIDVASHIYSALMSEQECKDAAAFFKTPVGAKYVDVQAPLFANVSPVMEQWGRSLSARIFDRVRTEMKKKGHEF